MSRTVFVPRLCTGKASGFLFGVESSLISGDGYACAFLLLHADSLRGNDAELNLINKFKSSCFDLLCLGFWEKATRTFKTLTYDSGRSHQIYVVFNGEALVHSKLLSSPAARGRDVGNDAIAWLFDVLRTDFRLGDLLQSHLRMQNQPSSLFVDRTSLLIPTTREEASISSSSELRDNGRVKGDDGDSRGVIDNESDGERRFPGHDDDDVGGGNFASSKAATDPAFFFSFPNSWFFFSNASSSAFSTSEFPSKLFVLLNRHSAVCRQLTFKWRSWRGIFRFCDGERCTDRGENGAAPEVRAAADDDDAATRRRNASSSRKNDGVVSGEKFPDDAGAGAFLFGNLVSIWLVDVALGVAFAAVFFFFAVEPFSSQKIVAFSQAVALQLRRLIVWLQGVPAGLKLNKELSLFMGNFFFYHIHLWLGYLSFVEPALGFFTAVIPFLGFVGGVSTQIALVNDIHSALSLHVYCFYVYASRVFFFLFRAFSSLFRLFRGKKKNPLRNRIDSCQFDFAQLFVGTLVFTILLFLFPTVFLYYVVFTALRLLTLALQLAFTAFVDVVNRTPFYGILLRLISSPYTTSGMELNVASSLKSRYLGNKSNAVFLMTFRQASLRDVVATCRDELETFYHESTRKGEHAAGEYTKKGTNKSRDENLTSWCKGTAGKLCRGELIEPWRAF